MVWIVNPRDGTVEVHRGPAGFIEDPGHAREATRGPDDVPGLPLDGLVLGGPRVADLLA